MLDQKQILESLRANRWRYIAIALVAITTIWLIYSWTRPLSPLEVMQQLDKTSIATNPAKVQRLCTAQGVELVKWTEQNSNPSKGPSKSTYGAPIIAGDVCDIPATFQSGSDNGTATVRLLNQGGWKFHDIHFKEMNGKKIDLWLSYTKDHPYLTALWLNWDQLVNSLITGFAIGAGL